MEAKAERQKINRIKAVLAETGHTGKWLAEQLGKDPVTVSKWCTNTTQPDLYTLQKISTVLNSPHPLAPNPGKARKQPHPGGD